MNATVPPVGDDSWLPSISCYQGLPSGAEVTVSLLSPSQIIEMINLKREQGLFWVWGLDWLLYGSWVCCKSAHHGREHAVDQNYLSTLSAEAKGKEGAEAPPTVPFEDRAYHFPLVLDFWCTSVIPTLKGAEDCCEFKPSLGYLSSIW